MRVARLIRRIRGQLIEDVIIEAGPNAARHVAVTEEVFGRWGFRIHARPEFPLTGGPPVELTWAVYIVLVAPIASFFTALGTEAGKDAYVAAKAWVRDVMAARREAGGPGAIHLVDSSGTSLDIPTEIPDDALEALSEIDWDQTGGGMLVWDEGRRRWIDRAAGE